VTSIAPTAGPPYRSIEPPGPIVGTAIHAGHELRPEVAGCIALSDSQRLREEDPYTDRPDRPVLHR
jgi:N-formylglutamate deformylase